MIGQVLLVAAGGALGAAARYLSAGWVARAAGPGQVFLGTLAVNVVGSFAMGVLGRPAHRERPGTRACICFS